MRKTRFQRTISATGGERVALNAIFIMTENLSERLRHNFCLRNFSVEVKRDVDSRETTAAKKW